MSNTSLREKSLSIVVPALNEEEHIRPTVTDLLEAMEGRFETFEIIIINDGSSDRTGKIADELSSQHPEVKVVHHSSRRGIGAAYESGILAARMEYLTLVPGDHEVDPTTWPAFFDAVGTADLVIGYRANQRRARPLYRRLLSRVLTGMMGILFGLHLRDFQSLVVYPASVVRNRGLRSTGFSYQMELLIPLHRQGYTNVQRRSICLTLLAKRAGR